MANAQSTSTLRKIAAAAGIAFLLIAGTGCSASGKPLSGSSPSASTTADPVKYAQCMRNHGVAMSDPGPNGFNMPTGIPQNTVDKAQQACKQYGSGIGSAQLANGPGGASAPNPNDPKRQAILLQFASCMRDNGFKMPDPGSGSISVNGDDPAYAKAQKACQPILDLLTGPSKTASQ